MLQVVGAVLIKNDKILLPKRSSVLSKYPKFYEFPGGKVEKGETLKTALKRELNEELSIDVDETDILEFNENSLTTEKMVLTIFIVNKWRGNITLDPKIHSEIIAVNINELKNIEDLLESDKNIVDAVINYLFNSKL